jgi:hypothetical protein
MTAAPICGLRILGATAPDAIDRAIPVAQRSHTGQARAATPLSGSDLDVLVRKGYLAPEERGRHRAIKQALEAFLSDSARAHALSRRAPKNINGR